MKAYELLLGVIMMQKEAAINRGEFNQIVRIPNTTKRTQTFPELGMDESDAAEAVMRLENRYNIRIPDGVWMDEDKSVGNLYNYVRTAKPLVPTVKPKISSESIPAPGLLPRIKKKGLKI